jgi:hypothetical protein
MYFDKLLLRIFESIINYYNSDCGFVIADLKAR